MKSRRNQVILWVAIGVLVWRALVGGAGCVLFPQQSPVGELRLLERTDGTDIFRIEESWTTGPFTFLPPSADAVLIIDWPSSIHITDSLSQTVVFQGPVKVLFSEEE